MIWTAAQSAIEVAQAGDAAAYEAALKALGGTCGRCHQQFRVDRPGLPGELPLAIER